MRPRLLVAVQSERQRVLMVPRKIDLGGFARKNYAAVFALRIAMLCFIEENEKDLRQNDAVSLASFY